MTPFARDHAAAVEVALLVGLLRGDRGGEKEDAHHCLAAERPLDQGVHDEDDRDDGEEDAVDVDVYFGRRLIDPLLALSFPGVGSYSATNGLLVPPIAFAPGHSLGKPMRLDDRETK